VSVRFAVLRSAPRSSNVAAACAVHVLTFLGIVLICLLRQQDKQVLQPKSLHHQITKSQHSNTSHCQ